MRRIVDFLIHPEYVEVRAYFDVAIAVTNIAIDFTDVIRPINLPLQPIDDENAFEEQSVTLSGKVIIHKSRGEVSLFIEI